MGGAQRLEMNTKMRSMTLLVVLSTSQALSYPSRTIDTHVHITNMSLINYTFPASFPDLAHDWSLTQFTHASANAQRSVRGGFGVILMELEKQSNTRETGLTEARWYQQLADACPGRSLGCTAVAGFVASAPLEEGAEHVAAYLAELTTSFPAVRGIREGLWKRAPEFFTSPSFVAGVRVLAKHSLPFDLLVKPYQLSSVLQLVDLVPEVQFNLNHLGYPDISNTSAYVSWATAMTQLSKRPNCYVKLSGLPQTYAHCGWTESDFLPYIKHILTVFGASRVNFAGNWFILNEARWCGEYTHMFNTVLKCLDNLNVSAHNVDQIFWGTAQALYNVSVVG